MQTFNSEILVELYKKSYNYNFSYLFGDTKKIIFCACNNCSLKYFYPGIGGDNKFYSILQKEDNYYFTDKYEYKVVKKYFNKKLDVLEIGAGKGAFSKLIQYKTYTGIELNESAVKLAKKEKVNLFYGTIQDYVKKIDTKYDIVCSFQVLEHVFLKDLHSFIKSSCDVLKKGGKLIIVVPSDSSFLGDTPNSTLNLPPHHLTRWADKVFTKLEEIFNIRMLDMYYEPLKEINFNSYLAYRLKKTLNYHPTLVKENFSLAEKILNKFVKLTPIQLKKGIIKKDNARGHSIIVVYEKL